MTEAKYLINLALLAGPHPLWRHPVREESLRLDVLPENGGWTPQPLHDSSSRNLAMGSYNCLVDLNGHKHTDGKTLLYLIDGLYPSKNQTSGVIRFASFGNDWFSSLLASQDMVAIDSVGLDFLRAEQAAGPTVVDVVGNPDNYLHEAASASKPPSAPIRPGRRREDPGEHGLTSTGTTQPRGSTRVTWEQATASSWCSRICRG